ncbi:MAG: hypothetical protein LWW85_02090 [Marinilabiliales bacterium]|nr:hypothetical protein [Marinilabiliales bacterium]
MKRKIWIGTLLLVTFGVWAATGETLQNRNSGNSNAQANGTAQYGNCTGAQQGKSNGKGTCKGNGKGGQHRYRNGQQGCTAGSCQGAGFTDLNHNGICDRQEAQSAQ